MLAPEIVVVPLPVFITDPLPLIVPANVVLDELPKVNAVAFVPLPRTMLLELPPAIDPTVCAETFNASVAPDPTVSAVTDGSAALVVIVTPFIRFATSAWLNARL